PRADRGAHPRPPRRHRLQPARPGRPRPEGGVQGPLRRSRPRRLRAGAGQWTGRRPHRRPGARPPDQAQHRGRHRPPEGGPIGPVTEMGKWRRHLFEGVAANLEADTDGPPAGAMLKGPWRDLDPRWRHAWLYGLGDRVIVHRWRNRGKHWTHAEKWPGIAS